MVLPLTMAASERAPIAGNELTTYLLASAEFLGIAMNRAR